MMNHDWYNTLPLIRDKRFRLGALSVFGFGMLAHAYSYFSLYHSHDSLYCLNRTDVAVHISYGRFMQPVYFTMRGNLSVPWFMGMLCLLWIALSLYVLVRMLEVKQSVSIVLMGGLMSTGTMLAATNATYFNFTDIFMLAFLLAAIAVWMTDHWKWGFLPGALCMVVCLGLYQSFIGAACGLLVILFIRKLLQKDSFKELAFFVARGVCMLLLGGIGYKLTLDMVLSATGIELANTYNGLKGLGDYVGYSRMKLILDAYRYIIDSFIHPHTWHPTIGAAASVLLLVTGLVCLAALLKRNAVKWWHAALTVAAIAVLPFALNITYFVSKGMVHELMIYQFILLPVLAVILADWWMQQSGTCIKVLRHIVMASVLLMMALSAIYSNGAYLNKQLQFEATEAAVNRIVMTMENTDGYHYGETPVSFVGELSSSDALVARPGFEGYRAIGMGAQSAITFFETENDFMTHVMGYPVNWVDLETEKALEKNEAVIAMPAFPDKGYCQMVDGILVVKLEKSK